MIREYAMVGDVLALDIDATSFWTIRDDQLVRVDIATGAVLASSVQSPRSVLAAIVLALAAIATLILRGH